jgi:hypothetical protein
MGRSRVPPFLMLFPIVLFSALRPPQCLEPSGREAPTVTLGIVIELPAGGPWPVADGEDHADLIMPAIGTGEMLGIVAVPEGRFAGIRITPSVGNENSVKINVSGLVTAHTKLSEATGTELQSWQSEDAGSYEGKKDKSLLLSGLARLGLPVLKIKVVGYPPPGLPAMVFGPHMPPGSPAKQEERTQTARTKCTTGAMCWLEKTRDKLNPDIGAAAFVQPGKCGGMGMGEFAQCCWISKP